MNRFEEANTAYLVDGYIMPPRALETKKKKFNQAKKEVIETLKRQIAHVEELTIEHYERQKRKDFKA